MTTYASLNPYWRQYFAQHEAQGLSLEEVLGDINQLNLKEPGEIDLALCLQMPKLRFIRIWAPGPVVGIENIPLIPQLRELIIGSNSFTQEHLPLIAASPLLNNLVIIQIPFDDLDALNDSPRIKSLSLVGVTTLAPEAIARLTKITTLRISKLGTVDLAPLASMPKLRVLELDRLQLENLKVLGAKKLVDFDYGDKAADESDLVLVGQRTQLVAFNYPVSDVAPLAGLTKLVSITLDGSVAHDLEQISHLQIGSVHVHFAPSKETAQELIAQAKLVWPSMRSTGYRVEWER